VIGQAYFLGQIDGSSETAQSVTDQSLRWAVPLPICYLLSAIRERASAEFPLVVWSVLFLNTKT
jgi:hypothetical protein